MQQIWKISIFIFDFKIGIGYNENQTIFKNWMQWAMPRYSQVWTVSTVYNQLHKLYFWMLLPKLGKNM